MQGWISVEALWGVEIAKPMQQLLAWKVAAVLRKAASLFVSALDSSGRCSAYSTTTVQSPAIKSGSVANENMFDSPAPSSAHPKTACVGFRDTRRLTTKRPREQANSFASALEIFIGGDMP